MFGNRIRIDRAHETTEAIEEPEDLGLAQIMKMVEEIRQALQGNNSQKAKVITFRLQNAERDDQLGSEGFKNYVHDQYLDNVLGIRGLPPAHFGKTRRPGSGRKPGSHAEGRHR